MRICLNPDHPHPERDAAPTQLVCSEPMCGYLLGGSIISSRWQVSSLFASGPVADLYLGLDVNGPANVPAGMAIKVLRAPTIGPPEWLEQKVTQLLSLRHRNITPVISAGWTAQSGSLYLLSPFMARGSLSHPSFTAASFTPTAVGSIVWQIAEALHYAHEHQIVHGRLKLDNCLLVEGGIVQVSDFFYYLLNEPERYADPTFAAPEQFYGQAEAASDQYSLALLAYQLLIGQLPFGEGGTRNRLAPQEQSLMRPVTQVRGDVSGPVDQALARALSRQPRDRFPSIAAFAVEFQRALDAGAALPGSNPSNVPSNVPTYTPSPPISQLSPQPPILDELEDPQSIPTQLHLSSPGRLLPICALPGHISPVTLIRWAPDGIHLASAGGDQSIRLWSVQHRVGTPVAMLTGHSDKVSALNWSPDSSALVSGGADATVRTWLRAETTVQTAWWGHDGSVTAVAWSPSGTHIASGGSDRTIRLWDRLGNAVSVWAAHGRGGVSSLAWSPDGRTLASGGADHLICLWDITTRTLLVTLDGHSDEIRSLLWSPNGRLLASYAGKKDLRIGIWTSAINGPAAMLGGPSREIVGLSWSVDGAWITAASADATLRHWDTYRRIGEPIGLPVNLEHPPLCMAGSQANGMIAMSFPDMLIQVFQLQTIS